MEAMDGSAQARTLVREALELLTTAGLAGRTEVAAAVDRLAQASDLLRRPVAVPVNAPHTRH